MRILRLLLAFLPYLVVLGALAAGGLWYAFGIVAVVTLMMSAGILLAVRALRADARRGRPLAATEWADRLARIWWAFGLVSAALATAAFFPFLRQEALWVMPLYVVAIFLVTGTAVRLSAIWVRRYEQEFERFTRRRDPPQRAT